MSSGWRHRAVAGGLQSPPPAASPFPPHSAGRFVFYLLLQGQQHAPPTAAEATPMEKRGILPPSTSSQRTWWQRASSRRYSGTGRQPYASMERSCLTTPSSPPPTLPEPIFSSGWAATRRPSATMGTYALLVFGEGGKAPPEPLLSPLLSAPLAGPAVLASPPRDACGHCSVLGVLGQAGGSPCKAGSSAGGTPRG